MNDKSTTDQSCIRDGSAKGFLVDWLLSLWGDLRTDLHLHSGHRVFGEARHTV
jgi:hypothetical protein